MLILPRRAPSTAGGLRSGEDEARLLPRVVYTPGSAQWRGRGWRSTFPIYRGELNNKHFFGGIENWTETL